MREATLTGATAADQMTLRRSNLALVLRSLRDGGPRSRARLAAELGLDPLDRVRAWSPSSPSAGLVRDGRRRARAASAARAPRSSSTASAVCGIGAEINVNHVATLALDLAGDGRRASTGSPSTRSGSSADEVLDRLGGPGRRAPSRTSRAAAPTRSASPSASPAWSTATRDVLTLGPNLGWRDVPVGDLLRRAASAAAVPGRVDNEANLAAIAEAMPGDAERQDILVIFGEVGVGGGIVADGRLLRGTARVRRRVRPHDRRARRAAAAAAAGSAAGRPSSACAPCSTRAADPDDPVRDPALGARGPARRDQPPGRRSATPAPWPPSSRSAAGSGVGAAMLANALNPGGDRASAATSPRSAPLAAPGHRGRAARPACSRPTPAAPGSSSPPSASPPPSAAAPPLALETVFDDPTRVARRVAATRGAVR